MPRRYSGLNRRGQGYLCDLEKPGTVTGCEKNSHGVDRSLWLRLCYVRAGRTKQALGRVMKLTPIIYRRLPESSLCAVAGTGPEETKLIVPLWDSEYFLASA
jgi:hypothetical protein